MRWSSCCTAAVCASPSWWRSSQPHRAQSSRLDRSSPTRSAHVLGKGGKRRSVPVGGAAAGGDRALAAVARRDGAAADEPALFVSRRGTRLSASQVRTRLAQLARARRAADARASAHAAPQLRLAPAAIAAATCARCRSCWATPTSRPRRSTRGSTSSTWRGCTTRRIRARRRGDEGRAPARGQGALAAAPPPVGVRGQRRQGRRRRRRDGAGRGARRALSGLGRVQPAARRSACAPGASTRPSASTRAFFERRLAAAVALRSAAADRQRRACAWCTARPTACRA